MNIKQLGSNQTLLITNHGDEVLFSYETAVAGFSHLLNNYFVTNKKYSVTTTKHINKYLGSRRMTSKETVLTHEEIEGIFLGE